MKKTPDPNLKKAALYYRDRWGFSIIPTLEKKPIIKWAEYQRRLPEAEEIEDWWRSVPQANPGIVTGSVSNIMVVDVDTEEGRTALHEYLPDSLDIPIVTTPSGGWHYYFKYRAGLPNKARVLTGCDVRTEGGFIVAPPSKNGNGGYKWDDTANIKQIDPPEMPDTLFNILSSSTNNTINNSKNHAENCNITFSNIEFGKGTRDQAIFHLANHLVIGKMPLEHIRKYLHFFAENCTPPFPRNEVEIKINSALERATKHNKGLTEEVREWVKQQFGNFDVTKAQRELHFVTKSEKAKLRTVLCRLAEQGAIERVEGRGVYRRVEEEGDIETLDFLNANSDPVDVKLPFGLNKIVEIEPGNICLVAGAPNAGKTGVMLNVVRDNMRKFRVRYFSSEMGASELRRRLSKFGMPMKDWCFDAKGYKQDYSDHLLRGDGNINVIDYMEIYTNFYEVSDYINRIFRKLDGALCFIALQKNPGSETGLGGMRTLEKPRLALALDFQEIKIVKAKNLIIDKSPAGWKKGFKLLNGCDIMETSEWE